ncbi:hypothetical protein CMI47_07910 [Candidatus Pacearchaeota archaeon]|jgi:hypothetical protein|nr:hypothetical protein [Candidatus Pacearchaeota archaeon]
MKITRRQLRRLIVEVSTWEKGEYDYTDASGLGARLGLSDSGASDDLDNDGDGEVDEADENYFLMGGTVSELITYLQALDGGLPVSCYIGEGAYLTRETTCSFAVLQPGDGTEEVEITAPTFAIICES